MIGVGGAAKSKVGALKLHFDAEIAVLKGDLREGNFHL